MNFKVNLNTKNLTVVKPIKNSIINNINNRIKIWWYLALTFLCGIISSIPIWIWCGWYYAWRIFLSSLFLFLVFNGINNLRRRVHSEWVKFLRENGKIDYEK